MLLLYRREMDYGIETHQVQETKTDAQWLFAWLHIIFDVVMESNIYLSMFIWMSNSFPFLFLSSSTKHVSYIHF